MRSGPRQDSNSAPDGTDTDAGATIIWVGVEGRGMLGTLAFADTLRTDALDVVRRLQDLGVRAALLSGDNPEATQAAAEQAGIAVRMDDIEAMYCKSPRPLR